MAIECCLGRVETLNDVNYSVHLTSRSGCHHFLSNGGPSFHKVQANHTITYINK